MKRALLVTCRVDFLTKSTYSTIRLEFSSCQHVSAYLTKESETKTITQHVYGMNQIRKIILANNSIVLSIGTSNVFGRQCKKTLVTGKLSEVKTETGVICFTCR